MTGDELIYLGEEVWQPCPDFPDSYVSSHGRVRGSSGRILKQQPHHNGYLRVRLYCPTTRNKYTWRVHRLVATVFIENTDDLPEVHHRDHDIENNHIDNLEWCTRQDNIDYRYAEDREVCGHEPSYYYSDAEHDAIMSV